jgi:hypothetical protein
MPFLMEDSAMETKADVSYAAVTGVPKYELTKSFERYVPQKSSTPLVLCVVVASALERV